MSASPIAVVINPNAGPSSRRSSRADMRALAQRASDAAGLAHTVVFTERGGHARELAADLSDRGYSPVVAWGGDGTVNEVAGALVHRPTVLGIVPAGSGNGLARELGISLRPRDAMWIAAQGADRRIDTGELGGRYFVNVGGVGLAASVAELFSHLSGRGLRTYMQATVAKVLSYRAERYRLEFEGAAEEPEALIIEIANGRQYGNGALIAPGALLDDGRLEVVIVGPMSLPRIAWSVPRLFAGSIDRHPLVKTRSVSSVTLSSNTLMPFHVDGEPMPAQSTLTARVHPNALNVRVPRS